MRYIITHEVYHKYLWERENFNYLAHVYGVKAYHNARLSRVFYDVGDKKNSALVTTITFPKIDDIKWTNHRIIEQFVT